MQLLKYRRIGGASSKTITRYLGYRVRRIHGGVASSKAQTILSPSASVYLRVKRPTSIRSSAFCSKLPGRRLRTEVKSSNNWQEQIQGCSSGYRRLITPKSSQARTIAVPSVPILRQA